VESLQEALTDYTPAVADDGSLSLEVPVEFAGQRLDQVLAALLPEYSRSRLQAWIRAGHVRLDGREASPAQRVKPFAALTVKVQPGAEALAFRAEPMALPVRYQDAALIVIDKPAGLVVHPAPGNWSGTLLNGLLHHDPALAVVPRAGIVHRLDRDTSGLLVVARTIAAQASLVRQLQARSVRREYLALVVGRIDQSGTVDAPIGRHPRDRTRMAIVADGKPAVTHYEPVEALPGHTLLRCRLETGRTHQIRVHLQSIGFPLAGDPVYGTAGRAVPALLRAAAAAFGRQALHATRLALLHPHTGQTCDWDSSLPADMAELLQALRGSEDRRQNAEDRIEGRKQKTEGGRQRTVRTEGSNIEQ